MVTALNLEDPIITIRDLIVANYTPGNVPTLDPETPRISTGWWDHTHEDPQITITDRDDPPVGGGESGWTGIKGDGSGPVQRIVGGCRVIAWAARNDDGSGPNPKKVRHEVGAEIRRILIANASSGAGSLDWLGIDGPTDDETKDDADRMVFRAIYDVRYGYLLEP